MIHARAVIINDRTDVIQRDWVDAWNNLESWLNQYTPGWMYVQVGTEYHIEFIRESDLTLYCLHWTN